MQMLPRLAANDVVNRIPSNTKLTRKFDLRGTPFIESPQDVSHLRLCDGGTVMTLAAARAIFSNPIGDVVGIASKEQVSWVNAKPVVALMTDAHTSWDFAVANGPRVAMRGPVFLWPGRVKSTVSRDRNVPSPIPASVGSARLVDSRPESLVVRLDSRQANAGVRTKRTRCAVGFESRNRLTAVLACVQGIGRLLLHRNNPFGATPPAVSAARGHLNLFKELYPI